jgi:cardiolipin synthase A/B
VLLFLVILAHLLGVATAVRALMSTRTAQGTVAWILALLVVPYLAVPAYWIFGSPRFEGYVTARRGGDSRLRRSLRGVPELAEPFRVELPQTRGGIRAVERLAQMPVLEGNETELLIDGPSTFESLFEGVARARRYILMQFYTVKDDGLGGQMQESLLARARDGGPGLLPLRQNREPESPGQLRGAAH